MAVLAALALLDADQHAGAVDLGDLEVGDLRDAQATVIGDAQGGAVLQVPRMRQQQHDSCVLSTTGGRSGVGSRASAPAAGGV